MNLKTVVVFGATGTQGRPQVRELVRQGYEVRAVSRDPGLLEQPDFAGTRPVRADYDDQASLAAALRGADAIFYQSPAMGDIDRVNRHTKNLRQAAERNGIRSIIVNSSMWAPDAPCGQVSYDGVLAMEEVMRDGPIPVTIFRPTIFMSNLLGAWIKPNLQKGLYRYSHKPELSCDWICLEDVARFMVAALQRPELADRKIRIGGPQRLGTTDVVAIVGEAMGKPLRYEYITPQQFGEEFYDLWGPATGLDRKTFVDGFDTFYTFSNDAPQKPFQADVKAALQLIPVELTDLRTWAKAQDWS